MDTVTLEEWNGSQWESREIAIDAEDFSINDEALEAEMCQIGRKLYFYSNLSSALYAQALRKKNRLREVEGQTALNARKSIDKPSEGKVKEYVSVDKNCIDSFNEWLDSDADYQRVERLYRALTKIADVLISLGYKHNRELKMLGGSFE
jgi:hypothetical protein